MLVFFIDREPGAVVLGIAEERLTSGTGIMLLAAEARSFYSPFSLEPLTAIGVRRVQWIQRALGGAHYGGVPRQRIFPDPDQKVNDAGMIVQAPATTTTTTTTRRVEPVITYQQVQQDLPRYQLPREKGNNEVYHDRQTGQKVKVKRESD